MARSIHTTRRDVEDAGGESYADSAIARKRLGRLTAELDLKRAIKASVLEQRQAPAHARPVSPTSHEVIPIEVVEPIAFLLHPASEADLRAVMAHLPAGVADGLRAIELAVGRYEGADLYDPDPLTGRPGDEFVPGLWRPAINGYYSPEEGTIRLFGFVVSPECGLIDLLPPYLRARTLGTFVHELAHHEDHTKRVARGRWRAEDERHVEQYARQRQYEWTRDVVVPYVLDNYPEEVEALLDWIELSGGVRVPLETVVGDPRRWLGFPDALEDLMTNVLNGFAPIDAKIQFAKDLQFGGYSEEIFQIVDSILLCRRDDADALLQRAEAMCSEGRLDEAEAVAASVIGNDERNGYAWEFLARVHTRRFEWSRVEEAATRALEHLPSNARYPKAHALEARARARLALEQLEGVEADLRALEHAPYNSPPAQVLWAVLLLELGRYEEALSWVRSVLARSPRWETRRPELSAVRFEAAMRLGRPREAGKLPNDISERLRQRGYGEWAERLGSGAASAKS